MLLLLLTVVTLHSASIIVPTNIASSFSLVADARLLAPAAIPPLAQADQGLPPPAVPQPGIPPAPPPPPPPRVYIVYFDWDKSNPTPEGQQIIQRAASQYRAGGSVQLQVTGYTDLSRSAGYDQRLSERRADAVASALAALGIPRSDMVVTGRGMNDPRVPTAPGVREPQNNRVEIVFP
jgi:OmpA-OmpF porin, OOP family